jgi:hypothetical protein
MPDKIKQLLAAMSGGASGLPASVVEGLRAHLEKQAAALQDVYSNAGADAPSVAGSGSIIARRLQQNANATPLEDSPRSFSRRSLLRKAEEFKLEMGKMSGVVGIVRCNCKRKFTDFSPFVLFRS